MIEINVIHRKRGWALKRKGGLISIRNFKTKEEALFHAGKNFSKDRIVIHRKDGTVKLVINPADTVKLITNQADEPKASFTYRGGTYMYLGLVFDLKTRESVDLIMNAYVDRISAGNPPSIASVIKEVIGLEYCIYDGDTYDSDGGTVNTFRLNFYVAESMYDKSVCKVERWRADNELTDILKIVVFPPTNRIDKEDLSGLKIEK